MEPAYGPNDVQASATGAAGQITATLAAAPGKVTYLAGFVVTGTGATAQTVVTVTITGCATTMSFSVVVPAIATTPSITPLAVTFGRPIPSSAVNTAIVITVPTFGAGNTAVAAAAWGFYT